MPFPFSLPTTSRLNFQNNLTSSTHPSLPAAATSERNVVYSAFKAHKRLPEAAQVNNYQSLLSALEKYLPYVLTIDAALSGKAVAGEDIDIALTKEIEVEWRTTLASSIVPGRDSAKTKGRGLDYEIYFVLHTLAMLQSLIARSALLGLHAPTVPQPEQRLLIVQSATKSLYIAHSVHDYLRLRSNGPDGPPSFPANAVDILPTTQTALAHLASAEIALSYVLKDDPYPAILVQSRNKNDREWMIKAPEIPKLRAQILARLCIGAAERAATACSTLKAESVSKELISYCQDLRLTCRAKGCRFLALDADIGGETGKAIAWLRGGMSELGMDVPKESPISGGLSKLKSSWNERREDKRLEKGVGNWGIDAGKAEEGRILEWLERKLSKMNDTINVQIVPDWKQLLGNMPSGREIPIPKSWSPPLLAEDVLAEKRAPPDAYGQNEDSEISENIDGEQENHQKARAPVGAFPGTTHEQQNSYY